MAQHMPFAKHIVKLVDIYRKFFTHDQNVCHTHQNFKYFRENIDF
jgi:hypothetical protein